MQIVEETNKYSGKIFFRRSDGSLDKEYPNGVNAKDIMEVMILTAYKETGLEIRVEGDNIDAEELLSRLYDKLTQEESNEKYDMLSPFRLEKPEPVPQTGQQQRRRILFVIKRLDNQICAGVIYNANTNIMRALEERFDVDVHFNFNRIVFGLIEQALQERRYDVLITHVPFNKNIRGADYNNPKAFYSAGIQIV